MAEEKKPKIDLKARLGKKDVAGGGGATATPAPGGIPAPPRGSVPPPVIGGGIPAPPISPGIPVPPFAQPSRPSRPPLPGEPVVAAPPPKPAEIKVEVGAEAAEAARANRKYIFIAGGAMAVIGVAIGWVFGQNAEKASREKAAINGASQVAKDVDTANAKIKELSDKIGAALGDLKQKKFPESFASDLGALNIPFDAQNIAGKNVGSYPSNVVNMLFAYLSDVDALNARKDALKGLFSSQKKAITDELQAGDHPTLRYTVLLFKGPKGPVASIAPITDTWEFGGNWPDKFHMKNLITNEVQEVQRYTDGDPFTSKDKRLGIPIEPDSIKAAFPDPISTRILSELAKTAQILNGGGQDEGNDKGLLKEGQELSAALKKIAEKSGG